MTSSSCSIWVPGPRHPLVVGRAVALERPLGHQLAQVALLVHPLGHGEVGQPGGHQTQVEGAGQAQLARPLDHPGPAGEAPELLARPPQAGRRGRGEPTLQLGQRPAGPDGGQGGGQAEPGRRGVVHVVGGHRVDPPLGGQQGQGVVARRVERVPVVPQLDRHIGPPERLDQSAHLPGGRPWPGLHQRGGHRPFPASGEHQPVVPRRLRQGVEGEDGSPLLPALEVGLGQDGRQPGITLGIPGQHDEVGPARVGLTGTGPGRGQGHLGPEDRRQPTGPGRLGEPHHPVEAVMVGQSQRGQPQPMGFGHQLLGVTAAVQKAEARVGVQLGVDRPLSHAAQS